MLCSSGQSGISCLEETKSLEHSLKVSLDHVLQNNIEFERLEISNDEEHSQRVNINTYCACLGPD